MHAKEGDTTMIRRLISAMAMVMLLAGVATAQGNGMGVFFSDIEFTDETSNIDATSGTVDLYIVVLDCEFASVSQYECSLSFTGPAPTVTNVDGPAGAGWTNFGSDLNHQVMFLNPPVTVEGAAVLGIVTISVDSPSLVEVNLGPPVPATVPERPMVANGVDPDDYVGCGLTSGADIPGVVATVNGSGITATESLAWTAIRNLFE